MNPIEQIKDRLSILDVVSTYVKLEKSGNQHKGRCPFHNEKTPSFYVSPNYNSFHCFGCNKSGDIFSFVEEIEHIPFKEALEMLGERAGVDVRKSNNQKDISLLQVVKSAEEFYIDSLTNNKEAQLYLKERGVHTETQELFGIGYAQEEWRLLALYLQKKGYTDEQSAKAGLIIKTEKGYYDRWRGRIMFPLYNTSGKTVGFTGRVLPILENKNQNPVAKYVNSPETEIFHKSKILYGYHLARSSIVEAKECIVVEGQLDVVLSHQVNVKNVVGVSGTAFSEDQLSTLKRVTDKIVFCFDGDSAGTEALKRSVKLAYLMDFEIEVLTLPKGSDPADVITNNPDDWHKYTKEKVSVINFLTTSITSNNESNNLPKIIIKELFPIIVCVESSMKQDILLEEISKITNIAYNSLIEDYKKYKNLERVDSKQIPQIDVEQKPSTTANKESVILELLALDILSSDKGVYKETVSTMYDTYGLKDKSILDSPPDQTSRYIVKNEHLVEDKVLFKKHVSDLLLTLEIGLIDSKIENIENSDDEKIMHQKFELLQKKDTIRKNTLN